MRSIDQDRWRRAGSGERVGGNDAITERRGRQQHAADDPERDFLRPRAHVQLIEKGTAGPQVDLGCAGPVAQSGERGKSRSPTRCPLVPKFQPDTQPCPLGSLTGRTGQDDAVHGSTLHPGQSCHRVAPARDEVANDQSAHAVSDQHDRQVCGYHGPLGGEQVGAAVDALVVRIAELPGLETRRTERGDEVRPDVAGFIQPVNQHDSQAAPAGAAGLGNAIPIIHRMHRRRKAAGKLVLQPDAQLALLSRVKLGPPAPAHDDERHEQQRDDGPRPRESRWV